MEIRAGTGGDEAGIFAGDLMRMYTRYCETLGWKVTIASANDGSAGGFREVVLEITGENVYGKLKFESGVHRVQRIPLTEAKGRVHTSAVTVAVLPEADEVEVYINPADIRLDVFRASGAGGQHVHTRTGLPDRPAAHGGRQQCAGDRADPRTGTRKPVRDIPGEDR